MNCLKDKIDEAFTKKLQKIDPKLSATWNNKLKKFEIFRGRHYILKVERLDSRLIEKLHQIDIWKNKDLIKQVDKHNEKIGEDEDRKLELLSNNLADKLTQRNF